MTAFWICLVFVLGCSYLLLWETARDRFLYSGPAVSVTQVNLPVHQLEATVNVCDLDAMRMPDEMMKHYIAQEMIQKLMHEIKPFITMKKEDHGYRTFSIARLMVVDRNKIKENPTCLIS